MREPIKKEACLLLLKEKYEELGRYPKRSDFDADTVAAVKSYFGPWPRALEAAGIKPVNEARIEKKQRKRARARENRRKYRQKKKESSSHAEERLSDKAEDTELKSGGHSDET